MGANEPVAPASLLQVAGTGRIVREKSLELWQRLWEPKIATLVNVHEHGRTLRLVAVGDNRIGKGGGAVAGAAELPRRSFAERMTELIERDDRVREAALALRAKPVSFPNLYIVYETVKGLMSPTGDRSHWKRLVERGWISGDDSERFYDTANFYRKGYPREPIKHPPEMLLDDATRFIERLFRRMIDELQPN